MKILVLGSGAGGGFPQWNCNCRMCAGHRSGRLRARSRTQSSIAVSRDGTDWILLNASPDLGAQLRATPALQPRSGLRHTPIGAVVLIDSQIDHAVGLLSLREGPRLQLHCAPAVHEDLSTGLPLLKVLESYCGVSWHPMQPTPAGGEWREVCGLRLQPVAVPGKAPPYSPRRKEEAVGNNLALVIEDPATGGRLFYAPGLARVGDTEQAFLDRCDCVMVDGTFWTEDEMVAAMLGSKYAADMGHLPQCDGPQGPGILSALAASRARRKVLIHINNSNPILDEDGPERVELTRRGIEVAYDGMQLDI